MSTQEMNPADDQRFLSAPEVADRWGTSARFVWLLAERHELACVRLSPRALRFRLEDVIAFEQQRLSPAV